jgi:hypothetical protein
MSDPHQAAVEDLSHFLENYWFKNFEHDFNIATNRDAKVNSCKGASQSAFEILRVLEKAMLNLVPEGTTCFEGVRVTDYHRPLSEMFAALDAIPLTEVEKELLNSQLEYLDKAVGIRMAGTHEILNPIDALSTLRHFPTGLLSLLKLFKQRNLAADVVDGILVRYDKEPAGGIAWIRFWRELDKAELNERDQRSLFNALSQVPQISQDLMANSECDFSALVEMQRKKFPKRDQTEIILFEIKEAIESLSPPNIDLLFGTLLFKMVFAHAIAENKKIVKVIRLKCSESSSQDGAPNNLIVTVEKAEQGVKPVTFPRADGHECSGIAEVINLLSRVLDESDENFEDWVLQIIVPPTLGYEFLGKDNIEDLLDNLSVVVGTPRRGGMSQRAQEKLDNSARRGLTEVVSCPNDYNKFHSEVPQARAIKLKTKARHKEVQLYAGRSSWSEEPECVWMKSFAELPFSLFVLCVNEDPQEDWREVLGINDNEIKIYELLNKLGQQQLDDESAPLVLWQDPRYEPMRARSVR